MVSGLQVGRRLREKGKGNRKAGGKFEEKRCVRMRQKIKRKRNRQDMVVEYV